MHFVNQRGIYHFGFQYLHIWFLTYDYIIILPRLIFTDFMLNWNSSKDQMLGLQ